LTKGVPVEIHVTKGRDRRPMQNAWLHLETLHKHLCGRRFWGRTDEHGRFTAHVAAGELKVRVTEGDWNLEKTIQVVDGRPAKVDLHRQHVDKGTIVGKLVLPPGVAADIRNTTVTVAGMDGESEDTVTVTTDAQGRFSAGIIAGRVSILATSPKEEFFGCGVVDVREGVTEIPMHPTIRYEGHVLGPQDQPLPGVTVRMLARLVDRDRERPPGTPDFRRQFAELFHDRNVVTDAQGHFVFPRTPQRMELDIWFTRPGETESAAYRQKYFEPGQTRPPEIIRIGPARKNASRATKPLETEMSDTLRDCRLAGIHALVIVSGGGDIAAPFTKTRILDPEKTGEQTADIYSYLPRVIDGPEAAKLPDRRAYFAAHKWPFPGTNSLFLAAIDGEGRELGRLALDLRDDQAAAKDVAAFLKKHLAPQHDAKAGYEAALAEARRSHRRVWVCVGQTRCGPCFSFSRWLDSQRELLAKDYVLFKFDDVRDLNGRELSVALKFDAHGVPCHSILDSDGKELINSIGPLGNIGDPSGSFEGIQHLRKMLKTSARNLSNDDVESLILRVPEE
jgi:Thioredoxin-like